MMDSPFEKIKFIGDIVNGAVAFGSLFTLNEWAAIASISWVAYRFLDDFYKKWKRGRD